MNWYYHVKSGLNMFRFWKEVCKTYAVPVSMCAVTLVLAKYIDFYCIPVWIAGVILYTAVYSLLTWALVLNEYEKNLVRGPVRKILSLLQKH